MKSHHTCYVSYEMEPDRNLSQVVKWDGRDIYGSVVLGRTVAKIEVLYHYLDCHSPVQETQMVEIEGLHPLGVDGHGNDLLSCDFDIHHHLAVDSGGIFFTSDGKRHDLRRLRTHRCLTIIHSSYIFKGSQQIDINLFF